MPPGTPRRGAPTSSGARPRRPSGCCAASGRATASTPRCWGACARRLRPARSRSRCPVTARRIAEPVPDTLFDVVAPGEVMLRLASRPPTRLEQARELDVSYGGTEANVLCALARLGHRTAWISALPRNVWGERLARELRGHGVDVGHVGWREDGRIGT